MIDSHQTVEAYYWAYAALQLPRCIPAKAVREETMELEIDHVMFPVYYNNPFLDLVEEIWKERKLGKVFAGPQNPLFKGVYFQSKSFYVEYISNTKTEPYWSNAVYVVVPKQYWAYYAAPAILTENFLVPKFGCGYSIISPDYPHLTKLIAKDESYDGLTILISKALEQKLLSVAGQKWAFPRTSKVRVHDSLKHVHDIAVIDDRSTLVAPLLQPNPLIRELLQ